MFTTCKIKNISGSITTLHGHEFAIDEIYTIADSARVSWASADLVLAAIVAEDFEIHGEAGAISGTSDQIDWLKCYMPHLMEIEKTPPFAEPTYRSKFTGTDEAVAVSIDDSEHIDYEVDVERYVYGGEVIAKNAEFGDYMTACIYDKDSVIPSAYRSALCEDWPTVATYVEKHWITCTGSNPVVNVMNTYPLNAKISAGLYMRITYHAANTGSERSVLVNYFMSKKL